MRADARANREAVVEAAATQIATHGIDISLTAVAEQAGVGIATLYRNFPTRDDLIRAVLADLETRMLAILERFQPQLEGDSEAAWNGFVHAVAALRPGALVAAFAAEFVADHHVAQPLAEKRIRSLAAVQQLLDQVKRAGLVRDDLTAARFQMGIASITRPLPDVAVPELAQHEAWLIDVYLRGLRP
ncbi:MAG: TetR/AcrR family transcriptional regulator [Propionicimonas sp.]|uniref:TetR/AcrR family transcriptional regulator n=1 Tax=Propionicimonas sp. TaxID=1955623 RepID=UPI002B22072C|nr:TetR/AcrR family transcriptional regulator [Propionicimonas sp.]MEA4945158.1 TetR/AcrR family transcriptional regulator [Propionicimonas sp.]MEA5054579.1 TetR/AcrR family transcriptional regulator [Propionicimonas sp.]MEA5118915.1 TetR/AcrR family transcriptional regulator [Propionicimonas sp.]